MFRKILIIFSLVFLFAAVLFFRFGCKEGKQTTSPRVVGIGIDGMDASLVEMLMAAGKLPNLSALAATGTYSRLRTTNPAESPVAWAAFATGTNPGKTGLFGFLSRDSQTYLPRYAPTTLVQGKSLLNLFPLKKPFYVNNRKGKSFWQIASQYGIRSLVLRCPETFPPVNINGAILSGMEVPDIRGTTGTFTIYTTEPLAGNSDEKVISIQFKKGKATTFVNGPSNWLKKNTESSNIPLKLKLIHHNRALRITVAGKSQELHSGEWSRWFEMKFPLSFLTNIKGMGRFYLQSVRPEFRLYLSPINIDPKEPALPISSPGNFAAELANSVGLYKTLGWDIDSWALNEGFLDEKAILKDAYQTLDQQEAMALYLLKNSSGDLWITVFGALDRLQHTFWRYLDKQHPLFDPQAAKEIRNAIPDYYMELDRIIGNIYSQLDSQSVLMVFSDHGFASFRRSVNLNTWLWKNNFLHLQAPFADSLTKEKFFTGVDWRQTRAYGLGIGGIYLNVAGRERNGIIEPGASYERVRNEISQQLLQLIDEKTGQKVVRHVYKREEIYSGPYVSNAPDLLVGLNPGYRISQASSLGGLEEQVVFDNVRKWSGDHVSVDPPRVPGVLFANRRMALQKAPSLIDIAPTILGLFGIPKPSGMDGQNLLANPKLESLTDKKRNRQNQRQQKLLKSSRERVLLIGLDGADWNRIEPLVRKGKLPHFARLMRDGAYGNLHSAKPLLSPMIWTTIATGKKPSEHEIFDFLVTDERNGQQVPVTSNLRKTKAIWNILSEQNKSVGVVGWLVTWPAEKVNGIMVSDRLAYLDFALRATQSPPSRALSYPETEMQTIRPLVVSPLTLSYDKIQPLLGIGQRKWQQSIREKINPAWSAASVVAATETYRKIARYLQQTRSFDFLAVYFKGIDSFGHLFASVSEPDTSEDGKKRLKKYGKAIANFYIYQDEILGNLLDSITDQTTVIIVSDHGFKLNGQAHSEIGSGSAVDWHTDKGIILLYGNKIRKHARLTNAQTLDIVPTILYLFGLPVASDMAGRVLTEALSDSNLKENPIQYIDSYEKNLVSSAESHAIASNEDRAIQERLETLGYLNPETANSYNSKGNFYMQRGNYLQAVAAFQKAVELQPKVAAFRDNLGNAYTALGQPEKAIVEHKKAIALAPKSYKAYNNLGMAYFALGKPNLARKAYEKALLLNPNFADACSNLGNLYYTEGKFKKAEELIRKSLQMNPDLARSHYNLGVMYGEKGLHRRAISEFQQVLRNNPYFPQRAHVHNGLGVAYFNLKKLPEALNEFRKVIEIDSTFPGIYSRIGLVELSSGNSPKAEEAFRKALKLDPGNLMIEQMLDELKKTKVKK